MTGTDLLISSVVQKNSVANSEYQTDWHLEGKTIINPTASKIQTEQVHRRSVTYISQETEDAFKKKKKHICEVQVDLEKAFSKVQGSNESQTAGTRLMRNCIPGLTHTLKIVLPKHRVKDKSAKTKMILEKGVP